jgi:probable rRNA maturation factor
MIVDKNVIVSNLKKYKIDKSLIKNVIEYLKDELIFEISDLEVNFVSSDKIIQINKKYLNHHFSTDIITFNYSNKKKKLDAELYISVENALFNSKRFGVTFEQEIVRLLIHGILHLMGYDDKTVQKKQIMKRKEDNLLSNFMNRTTS